MALVYTTLVHLQIGDTLVPPGTVISDAASRNVRDLLDKGLVTVQSTSDGGGAADDTDVAASTSAMANTGADETLDGNTARYYERTLDANCTISVANLETGEAIVLYVKQDATGGRTMTFSSPLTDQGADVVGALATDADTAHLLTLLQTSEGLVVLVSASSLA